MFWDLWGSGSPCFKFSALNQSNAARTGFWKFKCPLLPPKFTRASNLLSISLKRASPPREIRAKVWASMLRIFCSCIMCACRKLRPTNVNAFPNLLFTASKAADANAKQPLRTGVHKRHCAVHTRGAACTDDCLCHACAALVTRSV